MSDRKVPARWRTVPKLKNSNPDLYRIARGWRMRRIVAALLLLLCDLGIYRLYFFGTARFTPEKHVLFWLGAYLAPVLLFRLPRALFGRDRAMRIRSVSLRRTYDTRGPDWLSRRFARMTTVCDFRMEKPNGKTWLYTVNLELSHNAALREGIFCYRYVGLPYPVSADGAVGGYRICARCGYLNAAPLTACGKCHSSLIITPEPEKDPLSV